MAHVLILGGGFGGVAAAAVLAPAGVDVTLVDRRTHFFMGFRKIMAITGREPLDAGKRPLDALTAKGVRVVRGSIDAIEPASRAAVVDGERIEADAMLVALGADLAPGAIPGLTEHAVNVYDEGGVQPAHDALASLRDGTLLVGIFGVPYKCSPAPYELAILSNEVLRNRGSSAKVGVFSPQPMSLPVLGKSGCDSIEGRLAGQGITFHPSSKAVRVDAGRVELENGDSLAFDALFAIPPHKVPDVVADAGLAEKGKWVKVNPRTMETGVDGVYAAGDVTGIMMANGQPLPKAGAMAEAEGRVAAQRMLAVFAGREPDAVFDGTGACFLEVGNGEAQQVTGNFLAEPAPDVELSPASKENVEEKTRFERERLAAWFGA